MSLQYSNIKVQEIPCFGFGFFRVDQNDGLPLWQKIVLSLAVVGATATIVPQMLQLYSSTKAPAIQTGTPLSALPVAAVAHPSLVRHFIVLHLPCFSFCPDAPRPSSISACRCPCTSPPSQGRLPLWAMVHNFFLPQSLTPIFFLASGVALLFAAVRLFKPAQPTAEYAMLGVSGGVWICLLFW